MFYHTFTPTHLLPMIKRSYSEYQKSVLLEAKIRWLTKGSLTMSNSSLNGFISYDFPLITTTSSSSSTTISDNLFVSTSAHYNSSNTNTLVMKWCIHYDLVWFDQRSKHGSYIHGPTFYQQSHHHPSSTAPPVSYQISFHLQY